MLQDFDRIDIDDVPDTNGSPTLVCDYSENNLNQLFMKSKAMALEVGDYSYAGQTDLNSHSSPGKSEFNQMTKLDDEEENVDFIQMFNQYQIQQRAQVQYYQPNADAIQSERMNQSYQGVNNPAPMAAPKRQKKSGMRPSSATVAGQAGRFLSNQQSKRKVQQSGGYQKLDQVSYSYQQPANTQSNKQISMAQFVTHRNSNLVSNPGRPPIPGVRVKKVRPQSAARNQMQPSKELQSVTNFTYQKAKQNLNQKSYVPDSLKNTDKERLYEEKINLKKQLNDITRENQQLRTQLLSQQGLIRKKDEMVQQVMKQVFHPQASQTGSGENFLQEFQTREIQHAALKKVKMAQKQGSLVTKESQITNLKLKMKEINEMYNQKERELTDLKQTLKFTKLKEYESELALNVQESQRLRVLLEREIQKPKVDPRFLQSLKQQNSHYQQIIQNLQQNQQIQQDNWEKLNRKLVSKTKQFLRLKEARKNLKDKNHRLEKRLATMNQKINRQGLENQKIVAQARRKSIPQESKQWEKRFQQQNSIIEKLLIKMSEYGIEISEQSLIEIQNQIDDQDSQEIRASTMDLIVTFGPQLDQESVTKQMMGARFDSLNHLKETLIKEFNIVDDFTIKYVTEEGELNELTDNTWSHMKQLSETNQIQLAVELTNGVVDEEPSNYEDDFEEEDHNKIQKEALSIEKVQVHFEELMIILKIKQIKKEDALKYILHGLRDEDQKKVKKVTIAALHNQLVDKIGFSEEVSEKLARFLIEKPNEEGKVDFSMQASMRRKDLHDKVMSHLKEYMLYNGLAITSLLNRLQGMFEDYKVELLEELESQDYDDLGTCPMADIYKSMKLVGLYPDSWDEDIREFVEFMAMRQSTGLGEIQYKELVKIFDEEYSYLEDKRSIWENFGDDGEVCSPYEPSSDEGELQSERSPPKAENKDQPSNVEDLEQNELLEKVDEILMQIVQRLPQSQKIKTLTQYLMPYLSPIFDQSQQRQYLIISQNAFIQFLLGQSQNQLGLELEESHIICLLHLLVQEDDQQDSQKYILYDEFIELVKTYMKKELIMQQSKSLGINYDILSKESVEFLFQIRSSLMHDNNNINENSASEDDYRPSTEKKTKQKSVPAHIREIFKSIIEAKSISLAKTKKGSTVEVMDFSQMLDILFVRLGIHSPGSKSLEELKFLICLDFKYLEMVMLIKFDKIMHDLDYISIDLLRQAQDSSLDKQRKKALDNLKKTRDQQLSLMKQKKPQIYGTSSQQIEFQGAGVTHSTKQEKKRKRPDDKKQGISKKMGGRQEVETSAGNKFDQDLSDQKQRSSGGKALDIDIEVEPNQSQDEGIEDLYEFDDDDKAKQMAIAAEIAAAENISEFDDDYLQDDIPIDEDEDDDDGIISDNYENFTKDIAPKAGQRPMTGKTPLDENVISMEHSDDLMESSPNIRGDVQPNDSQPDMDDSDNNYEDDDEDEDEDEDIDDNYPEEDEMDDDIDRYNEMLNRQQKDMDDIEDSNQYNFPVASEDQAIDDSSPMNDLNESQPMNESSPEQEPQTFTGTQQDFNFHQNDKDSSIQVLRTFDQEPEDMSPPPKDLSSEKEAQDLPLDRPQSSVQVVDDHQYIQDDDSAPEEEYSVHDDVQDGQKSLSKSPAVKNQSAIVSDEYIDDDFGDSNKSVEVKKSLEVKPTQVEQKNPTQVEQKKPTQPQEPQQQQYQQPQAQAQDEYSDDDYEF